MRRPPRSSRERLFGPLTLGVSLVQGLVVLALVAGTFAFARSAGYVEPEARALSFSTLIVANLGLIFANRSWSQTIPSRLRSPNQALWWVTGGAASFLGLALYLPVLRRIFHFANLGAREVLLCVGIGMLSVVWFELLKVVNRHWARA